jgi:hypothetical protein
MVTPLAASTIRIALKIQDFSTVDRFQETQYFECTEIGEICNLFAQDIHKTGLSKDNFFLPAPKTWIEFRPYPYDLDPRVRDFRSGFWIKEDTNKFWVLWTNSHGKNGNFTIDKKEYIGYSEKEYRRKVIEEAELPEKDRKDLMDQRWLLFILAMINTPRLVGRKQHMPDRKLEKTLLRNRPNIGKFPLQAWTEITLSVSAPTKDVSGQSSKEAHLTGNKPLHFCRQHWRVRLGRLERVKAHWRGDPSLGIKRSRYKVTP